MINLLKTLLPIIKPNNKQSFLKKCGDNTTVLDIGCGNNSVELIKQFLPNCYYIGVDIADYNLTSHSIIDEYILTSASEFNSAINSLRADIIICAHNIEHVDDPTGLLSAMANALKPSGKLYLSTPCEDSVSFPKMSGTLNFFDDPTHSANGPVSLDIMIAELLNNGLILKKTVRRNRPFFSAVIGLINLPVALARKRVMPGIWELFGFETIIWAENPSQK